LFGVWFPCCGAAADAAFGAFEEREVAVVAGAFRRFEVGVNVES
jgi:hypothetical protein